MVARRLWPGVGVVALALSACGGGGHDDLHRFMQETGMDEPETLDPLPPVKSPEALEYDAHGLESPFKARNLRPTQAGGGNKQPDFNRPREPLEEFPLDALRVMGTIEQSGRRYAIIRAPDGALHRVSKGSRIGQNFGVIIAIDPKDGLQIREIVQDSAGEWVEGRAVLAVR